MKNKSIFFIPALLLAACQTPITKSQYLHSLNVEWDGQPWQREVEAGVREGDLESTAPISNFKEQIDAIRESDDFKKAERVLVFIHGGLNTLNANQEATEKTLAAIEGWNRKILEDRNLGNPNDNKTIYPIFINWHSRLLTVVDRYWRIREGRDNKWAPYTSPLLFISDVGRSLGRTPSLWATESRKMLISVTTIGREINPGDAIQWDESHLKLHSQYPGPGKRWYHGILQIVPGVVRAVTIPIADFTLYEPYQMMLRRIDMMFRTEANYEKAASGAPVEPDGAVAQLMTMLMEKDDFGNKKKVILIGHSMGTIAANEVVRRYPEVDFTEIVYMAAACTGKDFLDTIPPYLERRNHSSRPDNGKELRTKFYSLSLHPLADRNEVTAWYLMPSGSLLEWLDSYVLRVKTPLDFTFGKWNNAMRILPLFSDYPPYVVDSMYFKAFQVNGEYFPRNHGDFRSFFYWDPAFWDPENEQAVNHL